MTSATLAPSASPPATAPRATTSYVDLRTSDRTRRPNWFLRTGYLRAVLPLGLLAVWQIGSSAGLISPRILDSPLTVLEALVDLTRTGTLQASLAASLTRAGIGFLFGLVIGTTLGLISGLSKVGNQLFDSLLQMLRTIPFLALIPLFVVWFGVGEQPKVILVAVACTFAIYMNTAAGVRNVDPKLVEAGEVFGLGRMARARTILVPLALPTILIGVRYSLGVSLLALVGAEQVNATSGIGYLALSPRNALRTDIVLGIVVVYALLGLGVDLLIRGIQRVVLPWHHTTRQAHGR